MSDSIIRLFADASAAALSQPTHILLLLFVIEMVQTYKR